MFLVLNRIEPARQIGGTWVVVGALVDDAAVTRNRWSKGASRCHSVIKSSMLNSSSCCGLHFLKIEFKCLLHRCLHSSVNWAITLSISLSLKSAHLKTASTISFRYNSALPISLMVLGRILLACGLLTAETFDGHHAVILSC